MTDTPGQRYAVVKKWKDHPGHVQIIEYFSDYEKAAHFVESIQPSKLFDLEVMRYD